MAGSNFSKNVVIVLALAGAAALVITRRVVPYLVDRATYTDGEQVWTTTRGEGLRYALWKPAEELGAGVNTPAHETRPALSPDGRWLVFGVGERGLNADLYLAPVAGGVPGEATSIGSLNSEYDELAPAFGRDALYFASSRPGGAGGFDLYSAAWDGESFGPAQRLPGGVNTEADELDPAVHGGGVAQSGGGTLYFASNRADGGRGDFDLFAAWFDPAAGRVETAPLVELSSPGEDREPGLTADGNTLFFASDRERPGDYDLYKSFRERGSWLPPRPLEGLNTTAIERGPGPSADGFALYFERAPSQAEPPDLFRAESIELFRLPAQPQGWMDLALLAALLLLALLAWMAKRWEQLDIIYKCFLVSVLVHLLLMWLMREVHPEAEGFQPGPGRDATFKVRVLRNDSAISALRERGGAVESERAVSEQAPTPERLVADGPAPELPMPGRASLERTASELAQAPTRAELHVQPAAASAELPAPQLADAEAAAPLRAGSAPSLEVAARAAERAPSAAPSQARPTRTSLAPQAVELPSSPGPVAVARVESRESRTTRFQPTAAAPAADLRADPRADVALEQPAEQLARRALGEPSDHLPEPVASAADVVPSRTEGVAAPSPVAARETDLQGSAFELPTPGAAALVARRSASTAPAAPAFRPSAAAPERLAENVTHLDGPELAGPVEPGPTERSREVAAAAEFDLPAPSGFEPTERTTTAQPDAPSLAAPTAAAVLSRPEAPSVPAPVAIAVDRPEPERVVPKPERPLASTPYRSRFGSEKQVALQTFGGGEDTERAVSDGLAYLATRQRSDGHWAEARDRDAKYHDVRVGNTGLCLLAFLGAGHTPQSGTQYSGVTRRAVDYLLSTQNRRNGHFGDTASYGHGIATYALAECFAITKSERLRPPLERAVRRVLEQQYTEESRGLERLAGGWGYYYGDGSTYDSWPRVSITAWQVMALESARLGGLEVDELALARAGRFIAGSWDERLGALRYSHDPQRLGSGYPTLPGSTPAGLFALSLLGQDLKDPRFAGARDYVMRRLPRGWRYAGEDAFVSRAQGNIYFLYYGSLAMLRAGGDDWRRWNVALKESLLPGQESDGSWRPLDVYARYAGDSRNDSVYTTAMCVLTLEVYYRYFTPLLERE